jgi:hypothetical protein
VLVVTRLGTDTGKGDAGSPSPAIAAKSSARSGWQRIMARRRQQRSVTYWIKSKQREAFANNVPLLAHRFNTELGPGRHVDKTSIGVCKFGGR